MAEVGDLTAGFVIQADAEGINRVVSILDNQMLAALGKIEVIMENVSQKLANWDFDKAKTNIHTLERGIGAVVNAVNAVGEKFTTTNEKTAESARHAKELAEHTKQAKQEAELLEGHYNKLGSILMKIGGLMGTIFAGREIYNTMVSMQRSQATFSGIMHDSEAAAEVLGKMRDYSMQMGFSYAAMTDAAKGFFQFGMKSDQVMDLLARMHDIAGNDTEAFHILGSTINQSFANLGKVERSTIFKLQNAGFALAPIIAQMRGITFEEFNAANTSISKAQITTKELLEAIKVATSEGGYAFQNAQRQALTLDGRIQALLETWRTKAANALNVLSPYLAKIVEAFGNLMESLWNIGAVLWRVFGLPIFAVIVFISRKFNDLTNYMNTHKDAVTTILKIIGYAFLSLALIVGAAIAGIVSGMVAAAFTIISALSQIKDKMIEVATTIAAIYIPSLREGQIEQMKLGASAVTTSGELAIEQVALTNLGRAARFAARGFTLLKVASVGLAAFAAIDLAWNAWDQQQNKNDGGLSGRLMGKGQDPFKDMLDKIKNQNTNVDVSNVFNINAPQDKSGKTNLTPEQVQGVLKASRGDFSMSLQKIMMEASNPK